MAISALVHGVLLVLYPVMDGVPVSTTLPPSDESSPETPEGLRLLALLELPPGVEAPDPPPVPLSETEPEDEPPDPVQETPSEVVAPPVVPSAGAARPAAAGEDEEEVGRRSAADLLRPGVPDPALFGEIELPPLSEEERYRLQLAGRLEAWQDSVRTDMERAAGATDWTHTDAEGNRWGVSPGRIHLGKFSLPLPFGFSTPPGLRDELDRRGWESGEIQRGAVDGAVWDAQRDRIREIRARREAERADTIRGGGGR